MVRAAAAHTRIEPSRTPGMMEPNPANGDGFVNWLTSHLINTLGHTPVTRTRSRIATVAGKEVSRGDVAARTGPVWAKTRKADMVLFARLNSSSRAIPDDETEAYIAARWG